MKKRASRYPTEALFKGLKTFFTSIPSEEDMRSRSKERSADLIERIAINIENQREHELLRTGGNGKVGEALPEANESLRETLPA